VVRVLKKMKVDAVREKIYVSLFRYLTKYKKIVIYKQQIKHIMKKTIFLTFALLLSVAAFSQKGTTAVLMYFKADLACCKARACGAIENEVKAIVENNFPNGNVVFKQVKISDPENASLVEQYKAQSQTVILVVKKKKKINSAEATSLIKEYQQKGDKVAFEAALVKFINDNIQ
jgi:hypothetical protein